MRSFACGVCGRGTVRPTYVTEQVDVAGELYVIKGVPVGLCPRCGKKYVDGHVECRLKELTEGANGRRFILYTNEHAIPGEPNACPEDEQESVTEVEKLW